ncbi:MAG: murein biosynthesis integral membrane protein MurJ [Deltaproteobacteria bacterium]|nr:murein biosynthesis integral membrane protein MurJ [Deltaproteobacteria bacterium]
MKPKLPSISIARGTSVVAGLTLLSRLLGLVRDLAVARLFGAGFFTDAFFVAFRIPNLLRSLVAEGALTSAFVPVFAEELRQGREAAQRTFSSATGLLLFSTTVLSIIGIIFAPEIVALTAPGFGLGTSKALLCITLTRIMLPYIVFVSLVAMLNGALNTLGIFGAAPLAQIAMNVVLILGALAAGLMEDYTAVIFLAISVILGGVAEIVVQFPGLKKAELRLRPSKAMLTPATRQIMKLMLPAVLGAAIYQLAIFINTLLASLLQNGSISWLFYADRIAQLPIGVFTVALASVLLPALSSAAAAADHRAFALKLTDALRYTSFFIIPVSAGLFFFAEPVVALVFERGAFNRAATSATAVAVQAMCIGLWSVSCTSMAMRAFIARKDTLTPALIGALALFTGTLLSLLLMGPPQSGTQGVLSRMVTWTQSLLADYFFTARLGHVGLALSSGLAQIVSLLTLIILLERRKLGIDWRPFVRSTYRALFGSAVMLAGLMYMDSFSFSHVSSLLIGLPLAGLLYTLTSAMLRSPELREIYASFVRWRVKRK